MTAQPPTGPRPDHERDFWQARQERRARREQATKVVVPVLAALCLAGFVVAVMTLSRSPAPSRGSGNDSGGAAAGPTSSATARRTTSAPVAAVAWSVRFTSPSRNIVCGLAADRARCDIVQRDYATPAAPAGCAGWAWGGSVQVTGTAAGGLVCAGTRVPGGGAGALAYGASRSAGPYRCTSSTDGMHCVDQRTGHGFEIARQAYRGF